MKLLVISHSFTTPSSHQDMFARVERLSGWDLTLILPRTWKSEYGEVEAERQPEGLQAKLLPLPVALNGNIPLHFYLARLSRVFAEERPDVIYVQHDPHGLATMQAFDANRRSVRVPIGFKNDQNIPKRYPWPIRVGERFVYRNAAFGLTPARPPAEALRQKGYQGPLKVVPYPVDLSMFRPLGSDRPQGDSLVVGFVGRLVPEKGVDTILDALAQTPETVRALIVGNGPAEAELRSQAARLGVADRVEWRGYVEYAATPAAYAEMDLLALPSKTTANWEEQFGRVVIEALACAVPVCSSDSGEPPTLIESTGGGWTFPEGQADALADRLRWAEQNREALRRTGETGLGRVREQFSADSVAQSFIDAVRAYALREDGRGR